MIKKGGHSKLIRPILYILDLLIISFSTYFFLSTNLVDVSVFILFWVVLSIVFLFYNVYRFTKIVEIVSLLTKQFSLFILLVYTYLYITDSEISYIYIFIFFVCLYLVFILWRTSLHLIFKKYRIVTGSNYKQVVIIGHNRTTSKLIDFFKEQPGYGYKVMGFFSNKNSNNKLGDIDDSFDYILNNSIDEIYCSIKEPSDAKIKEFIEFCDVKVKTLKFIPDDKEIYSKKIHLDYYDITPILSLREFPLDDPFKALSKRLFDIVFSLLIILGLLSWLIPILGLIIILESRGPIFFKQDRPGIKEKGFVCYKFRSMVINSRSEDSATRNDARVTKVGKFIRKTSIDELPQFFNVLFGSMSVVGPRPHLWRQNEIYGPKISKYMLRHFVKPGVTGLAQVRGYRGEIETKEDIVNRTKYDIFYIENWSILLDINIIVKTIFNTVKGEDKAY